MNLDEYLQKLEQGEWLERQRALKQLGFRLVICNRNRYQSEDAQIEASEIVKKSLGPVAKILARIDIEEPALRVTAVEFLGETFDRKAIPILIRATTDVNDAVARAADFSLFRFESATPQMRIHAAIQSAYQQLRPDSDFEPLLRGCLGHYSMPRWIFWRLFERNISKSNQHSDQADQYVRYGDFHTALRYYNAAIYHWPYDRVLWSSLGECFLKSGSKADGISCLKLGVNLSPFEPDPLTRLANGLAETGDNTGAEFWYSEAYGLDPAE